VSQPIGVGLIGCGHVAESRHLPALSRLEGARVVAVADLDADRARRVSERFAVQRRYEEPGELVEDPEVEVVAVLAPPADHAAATITAIRSGRHVLVEKPLAASLTDAERLIEAAHGASVKVAVGFNLRAHLLVRRARELLSEGLVGRVEAIHGLLSGNDGGEPGGERRGWRADRRRGGGLLFEVAPHHYDLWRHLTGAEVEEVTALTRDRGSGEVAAQVSARLGGGALASTTCVHSPTTVNTLSVQGPRGRLEISVLEYDGLRLTPSTTFPGNLRARARRVGEALAQLPRGLRALPRGGEYPLSYERQWERFLTAVREDGPVDCSLEDGRGALRVALAALASDARGQVVHTSAAPDGIEAALDGSR